LTEKANICVREKTKIFDWIPGNRLTKGQFGYWAKMIIVHMSNSN